MNGKFASRKLVVVLCAMLSAFALALLGKLTGEYSAILTVCVGLYQVAQGAVDYQKEKQNGVSAPLSPTP